MRCFELDLNQILNINLFGYEKLVPPRWHCERYAPEYIVYVVTEGELYLEESSSKIKLEKGDVYIFKKGDYHKALKSTFCSYYFIHFNTSYFAEYDLNETEIYESVKERKINFLRINEYSPERYLFMKVLLKQKIKLGNNALFDYITNSLKSVRKKTEGKEIERCLTLSNTMALIFLRLEEFFVAQTEKNDSGISKNYRRIEEIAAFIEKNYTSGINAKIIENEFFLNGDYANRLFKKYMGMSIIKYRNFLRINTAKTLILTTDKSLTEIAEETGFYDKSHFSRLFKMYEGINPGEFQKQCLKKAKT